jgi:cytochrome c553
MRTVVWMISVLSLVLGAAGQGKALVSEARPGIAYHEQVMFLDKKIVEAGDVVWVTLAYGDPRASRDCRNIIDVFNGRQLFVDIPEKSWVRVDFTLRSLVVQAGFSGDADVGKVVACPDEKACRNLQAQRLRDQKPAKPAEKTQTSVSSSGLNDDIQRMSQARNLVKVARCRGCHVVEGFGASHAPSLTWRRAKYQDGWLAAYLAAPYRLRPALTSLMMLRYTSALAQPSLQPEELSLLADFLQRLAWFTPPAGRFRLEPWQTYQCQPCHARLYAERPLVFIPSPVPQSLRKKMEESLSVKACLGCHTFGEVQTLASLSGPPYPYPMAPDLLLVLEKLRLDYFIDYVRDPKYLQPDTAMPKLQFSDLQHGEIREWARYVQQLMRQGKVQPIHLNYQMQKRP